MLILCGVFEINEIIIFFVEEMEVAIVHDFNDDSWRKLALMSNLPSEGGFL